MASVPLSCLRKGAEVYIESIADNPAFGVVDATVGRRLADLGFSTGMPFEVVGVGALGKGPFAVCLDNQAQFVLRAQEAAKVLCRLRGE